MKRYLVVSYKSSGTYHWGYGGCEDYSSGFYQKVCQSEEEVIDWIYKIELGERENGAYGFLYTHYLHTLNSIIDTYLDEIPQNWENIIKEKVEKEFENRVAAKKAEALAKAREAVIMKEQEERREYEKLSKKYGGFQNL